MAVILAVAHIGVDSINEALFKKYFCKLYARLYALDTNKCLPPRYSYAVKDLATFYGIFEQPSEAAEHSLSSISSDVSIHQLSLIAGGGGTSQPLSLENTSVTTPYDAPWKKRGSHLDYAQKISNRSYSVKSGNDESPNRPNEYSRHQRKHDLPASGNRSTDEEFAPCRSKSVPRGRKSVRNGATRRRNIGQTLRTDEGTVIRRRGGSSNKHGMELVANIKVK